MSVVLIKRKCVVESWGSCVMFPWQESGRESMQIAKLALGFKSVEQIEFIQHFQWGETKWKHLECSREGKQHSHDRSLGFRSRAYIQ